MRNETSGQLVRLLMLLGLSAVAPPSGAQTRTDSNAESAQTAPTYDPRDFEGVWSLAEGGQYGPQVVREGVRYTVYPYTPEYQAIYDKRIQDEIEGRPFQTAGETCLPSGLGRMLTGGGGPLEVFQTKDKVIILKENGGQHRIYLNRSHLPEDELYPMFYGDSVGHWEGAALVVDTISLGGAPYLDGIASYSDAATIVQRFRRVAWDRLEVQVTVTDPIALTRPITATAIHRLRPDYEMSEYYCTNERHLQQADGTQPVILN
jgi:hypothetical protein